MFHEVGITLTPNMSGTLQQQKIVDQFLSERQKLFNKILEMQSYDIWKIYQAWVEVIPGLQYCFNNWKPNNVIHHIKKNKGEKYIIILIDAENVLTELSILHDRKLAD